MFTCSSSVKKAATKKTWADVVKTGRRKSAGRGKKSVPAVKKVTTRMARVTSTKVKVVSLVFAAGYNNKHIDISISLYSLIFYRFIPFS